MFWLVRQGFAPEGNKLGFSRVLRTFERLHMLGQALDKPASDIHIALVGGKMRFWRQRRKSASLAQSLSDA